MGPTFVGRTHELSQLERELVPGAVVTLLGTAGTGKSRLAAEFVRRLAGRVRWVAGSRTPGQPSEPVAALGPTALVVFDDPETSSRAREWVVRLAEQVPVLVTSRDVLGCPGERVLPVGPLRPEDAERLAADRLGPGAGAHALRAVVELADGLPGGIELIARAARAAPLDDVLDHLRRLFDHHRSSGRRMPRSATMALLDRWAATPLPS